MEIIDIRLLQIINVDIYKRGLYRLRIRVCKESSSSGRPRSRKYYRHITGGKGESQTDGDFAVGKTFEIKYERQVLDLTENMRFSCDDTSEDRRGNNGLMIKWYLDYATSSAEQFKCTQKRRLTLSGTINDRISFQQLHFRKKQESTIDFLMQRQFVPSIDAYHDLITHDLTLALKSTFEKREREKFLQEQMAVFSSVQFRSASIECCSHYIKQYPLSDKRPLITIYTDNVDENLSLSKQFDEFTQINAHNHLEHIKISASTPNEQEKDYLNVIFCVPGLHGTHHDFRKFKNICKLSNATIQNYTYWHLCKSNNGQSFDDIEKQAENLTLEIEQTMNHETITKYHTSKVRISFIAFSLGGIIVRTALCNQRMLQFKSNLFTLETIATPHLGLWYNNNGVLEALMKSSVRLQGSKSIKQLLMQDTSAEEGGIGDKRQCLLYRISSNENAMVLLKQFKRIILVSSIDDLYVNSHSALVEIDRQAFKDGINGNYYLEMMVNLISAMKSTERVIVSFAGQNGEFKSKNVVYNYLGRDEHLAYLQCREVIREIGMLLFAS